MSFEKVILEYENKKGEGVKEEMEEHKLKNLLAKDAKRILETADQENIDVEAIIDFIKKLKEKEVKKMSDNEKTDDEIRFSAEEKKVEKYLEDHKSENLTYRDAVLACLDRSEPEIKKEFTAEEKKKRENLKIVEAYLESHPRATYSEGVRVALNKEELSLEEKLIQEFLEKHPKSTYREATLETLSLLKKEE